MVYETSMFGNEDQDSIMMDLTNTKVLEDDWLAPISETLQAQLDGNTMRRVYSAPAVKSPYYSSKIGGNPNWSTSTAPLPIRADVSHSSFPHHHSREDYYSSIESSQTLLAGHTSSFTDESALLHRQASFPVSSGHRGPSLTAATSIRHHSMPSSMSILDDSHHGLTPADAFAAVEIIPAHPPPAPPGQAGHWAWIPASTAEPTLVIPPSAPAPVAVSSTPLPLPVPMGSTLDLDDLDLDLLDSINVLEMADSLIPEKQRYQNHHHHHHHGSSALGPRAVGSCPLPALLENSFSNDDGSSDHTMQRSTASPPIDELELYHGRGTTSNAQGHHGTWSPGNSNHASSRQGIPIPGACSMPMKVHRPSRSLSSSALLGTSCPSSSNSRPIRNAARRSLAVTVAVLNDVGEDSDSELSEDVMPSSFNGSHHHRRLSTHGVSVHSREDAGGNGLSGGSKKKHNPWTLEETLALVEGVNQAGIGKWAEIKRLNCPGIAAVLESRSAVDLKDKWRNLTRVARLPKVALKARLQRGPSDVPLETMLLVKQLMEARQDAE